MRVKNRKCVQKLVKIVTEDPFLRFSLKSRWVGHIFEDATEFWGTSRNFAAPTFCCFGIHPVFIVAVRCTYHSTIGEFQGISGNFGEFRGISGNFGGFRGISGRANFGGFGAFWCVFG